MGARKREAAEKRKELKKQQYFAVLRDCPTSPRKMRLVADMIRGKFSSKEASVRVEKLLLSAVANWQAKNEGVRIEEHPLVVSRIMVDSGRILKRLRPAPQGRAHRIRKRSNHVTIFVDQKNDVVEKING